MRIWFKEWAGTHLLKDIVIEDKTDDTRTHKVFHALEKCCSEFDLSQPIWLESTIRDFKRHSRARFLKEAFVDEICFDYLEIQVIEED